MPYAFEQAGDPSERDRLALLQSYYDTKTIPKLRQIGVTSGWHCHDVGAGAGSIAKWLAERVAPMGSVLAVDLDLTLLEPLASPTLSVRRHDIRTDDLPLNADFVHARLLLEHLSDPETALKRLVRSLRPGGWILLTDTDFRSVRLSDPDPEFERIASAFASAANAFGWNTRLGPELASMLEHNGVCDVAAESWQTYERGGAPSTLLAMSYRRLRDKLIGHGASDSDVDQVVTRMLNATVGVFSPTSWMAWGRRA